MPSTSTLLDVANAVLLNMNERTVAALSGQLGLQLKNTIESALNELADASNWNFLGTVVNSTSWSGGRATMPSNTSRVRGVSWSNTTSGSTPITFVERQAFDQIPLRTYASSGRPNRWTFADDNVVLLNPYPTTPIEQSYVWFYIQEVLNLPTSDNSFFDIPQQYIQLLISCATSMYALRHNDDIGNAAAFRAEYEMKLKAFQLRHMTSPAQALNMYPGRRYGYPRNR